ncbi:MAG: hypothetical protein V1928_04485 [Parcubacteria group bacterium]
MWRWIEKIFTKKKNLIFRHYQNFYLITVPKDTQSLTKTIEFFSKAKINFVYDNDAPPTSYQIMKLRKDEEEAFFRALNEFCRQNKFKLTN